MALSPLRSLLIAIIDGYFGCAARIDRSRLGRVFLLDTQAAMMVMPMLIVICPRRIVRSMLRRMLADAVPGVRRLCLVDVPSMARERRSQTDAARAKSTLEALAATSLAHAIAHARSVIAELLDLLGAASVTLQPRLAASLAAASAAYQRS